MEDFVVVKSTSIVHPKNVVNQSDRVKKIHLTPWDLVRLGSRYPQRGLFFPKLNDSNIDTVISKLKTSLSIALDHYYPLAGRLVKQVNENDDTVSYFVSCDGGHGVRFVHAVAKTIVVSDLVKSGFADTLHGPLFFPATGFKNYQGVSSPLLVIQVTEVKDGVFIGFGYNHTVADGKSMWSFMNVWSEICSKDSMGISPCFRGWFLDGIEYPIHVKDPETNQASHGFSTTSNVLQELVFRLTKENVLKLKAKANEEVASDQISSFQAVLGLIWRLKVKHSGLGREEEAHCRVPIDMRRRLNPKLKEECFGNVIQTGIVVVSVGELLDNGIGWAGLQINEMVKSQTDENAKVFAENWVKNGDESSVAVSSTLFVTSSPRFNVYGNDFGWGKPIGVRTGPPSLSGGKLAVFQGVEEGGFEFQACFQPQLICKLLSDDEFLKYVDIAS